MPSSASADIAHDQGRVTRLFADMCCPRSPARPACTLRCCRFGACGCTRSQRATRGGRGARLTLHAPRRCNSMHTDDDRVEVTLAVNAVERKEMAFARRHVDFICATREADATVRRAAAPPRDRCRHTRSCVADRNGSTRVAPTSQVDFAMASQAQDFFLAHAMCRACRGFVSARDASCVLGLCGATRRARPLLGVSRH